MPQSNDGGDMWIEAKIHLPDEALERLFPADRGGTHAAEARNLTAKLNEAAGFPLPPEFFHYDGNGKSLTGRPAVRFGSFTRGISVYGVGTQGVDLVDGLAHRMRRMWSDHVGQPLLETRASGSNAIRWSGYPRKYFIHALALDVKQPWTFLKEDWLDVLRPAMARAVINGNASQVDSNHAAHASLRDSEVVSELDQLELGITGGEKVGFKRLNTNSEVSNAAVVVCKKVELVLPFELEGVWHVGRLPSRGFGLIRSQRAYGVAERA